MKFLVKLVVTSTLIGLIIWQLDGLGDVIGVMKQLDLWYLILILFINTGDRALMTFKWMLLLRSRGVRLPFIRGIKIYCAATIWGMFLPSTMGADAVRAISTSRMGLDSNEVVSSIIIERIIGFLSALILGMLSLVVLWLSGSLDARLNFVWWLGSLVLVGAAVVFVASFSRTASDLLCGWLPYPLRQNELTRRLGQVYASYRGYQDDKKTLALFFGLTFGEQLIPILHSWVIALSLGVEVSLLYIAGAVPLTILISRIPVSINGVGVSEGVFMVLLSLAGVPAAEAVAIVFVARILQTLSWLPWWLAHVFEDKRFTVPRPA